MSEHADSAEPDDSEPSSTRQQQLRAAYQSNSAAGRPPYAGAEIKTRGELSWVMSERGWQGGATQLAKIIDLRETDLSEAIFCGADLVGANLAGANLNAVDLSEGKLAAVGLTGAFLFGANLSKADANFADLSHANLSDANLSGANLSLANLTDANLTGVDLNEANLSLANLNGTLLFGSDLSHTTLSGANLTGANLSGIRGYTRYLPASLAGVNLTAACMDASTLLGTVDSRVSIDGSTRLLDVVWNGVSLAAVQWARAPRLGDELDIKAATTRQERIAAYTNAVRAYRGLVKALHAQGLTAVALHYRTRQFQLERRSLLLQRKFGGLLLSLLLNMVSGYGDRPGRAFACYVATISIFTCVYYAITNTIRGILLTQSPRLKWYEALVFSISSFHGRGFFPQTIHLGDAVAIAAAVEAVVGLFIELVFIATFTQRFFTQ